MKKRHNLRRAAGAVTFMHLSTKLLVCIFTVATAAVATVALILAIAYCHFTNLKPKTL